MVVVSLYCFYLDCLVLSGNLREEESRIHPERVCTRFFTLFRMTVLIYYLAIPVNLTLSNLSPLELVEASALNSMDVILSGKSSNVIVT